MATQNVNIGVNVSDNGTAAKTIKSVEALHNKLKEAQATAKNINVAGTSGSRAVAAKAQPPGYQGMSEQAYGSARGSAGLTGASARDFAAQSQGLGGLVRLYATYAANVFAVGAAFTALKNAADTTNLVRGLDTLGAASGRNLGALSKQLVAATDGAVSLQEAMTATAMASSAGMTNENIRRLAGVAKTASLALGVSMPDALNRLSRGIVKLEPELLDELGIFTKIDPAVQKYALETGKAVSQLTDFERRQAFANAVLAEGEKKFSALAEAAANPYDKLLANLKNVAQTGLELVNTVLVPIVSLLSQSPTALGAGMLAIISLIVKQALPAIGQLKEGLRSSADAALEAAKGKAGDALRAREQLNKLVEAKVEAAADKELKKFEELEAQLYGMREKGVRKRSSLYKILEKDLVDIGDKEIASAEKSVKALESRAKKDTSLKPQAELERATLDQLKNTIAAEEKLSALQVQNRANIETQLKSTGQYAKLQQQVLEYESKAKKDAIIANTAYNSSLLGVRASWQLFRAEVEKADLKLKSVPGSILLIRGAMATLTSVAVTLGNAINKAFFVIGIIATAVSVLDSVLSKAGKEIQKFNSALDAADDAAANAKRTLAAISIEQSSIQSTMALSNALTEVADTTKSVTTAFKEAEQASGVWENIWDTVKIPFRMDRATELSKVLSKQITSAIKLLEKEGLEKEFEDAVKKELNLDNLDVAKLPSILRNVTEAQRSVIVKILDDSKTKLGNVSSNLQKFKETSDSALKSYREYVQSTADTSPLFKLGQQLLDVGASMAQATLRAEDASKVFQELVDNPEKAAIYSQEFVTGFANIRGEFDKQKASVTAYNNRLKDLQAQLKKAKDDVANYESEDLIAPSTLIAKVTQLELETATIENAIVGIDTSALKAGGELLSAEIERSFTRGSELAKRALTEAQAAAGAAIAKASAAALTGERRIQEEADIQKKQLASQLAVVDSNIELARQQEQLITEMRLANALARASQAKEPAAQAAAAKDVSSAMIASATVKGQSVSNIIASAPEEDKKALQLQAREAQARAEIRNLQQQAQRAKIGGEISAVDISAEIAGRRARLQEQIELANNAAQTSKLYSDQLGLLQNMAGVTSRSLIAQQSATELKQVELKQQNDIAKLDLDIELARQRAAKSSGASRANYEAEIVVLNAKKSVLQASNAIELDNRGLQEKQKLQQKDLEIISRNYELTRSAAETEKAIALSVLDTKSQEFDLASSTYEVSQMYVISQRARLENERTMLELTSAIEQANSAMSQKQEEAERRLSDIRSDSAINQAERVLIEQEIANELTRQQAISNQSVAQLSAQYSSKLAIIESTKQLNTEQEKYNQLIQDSTSFAESLKSVFTKLGTELGSFTSALVEVGVQNEKNAQAMKLVEKARKDAYSTEDTKAIADAESAYNQQVKKNQKDELSGNLKILASAKGLFKEKSAGYKAINAIEKAMHLYKMAILVKETAMELWAVGKSIAASMSKMTAKTAEASVDGVAAVVKAIASMPFPLNIAAGAATAAVVAGLLSKIGGRNPGSVSGGFTPTAEQRQETQGTGTSFDSQGNKVENGGGVFGDSAQKLDSINKGIQTMKDNSIEGLFYDNRMLKALESMASALTGAAQSLYSQSGIRSGLNLAMPGTSLDTKWYQDIPVLGKVLGKVFGGGTSASSSIQDSGLKIVGTLDQIASGMQGSVSQYVQVLTQFSKDGGWLGKDKNWTTLETKSGAVTSEISSAIQDVFAGAKNMFTDIAGLAGITSSQVNSVFSSLSTNIDISLKDLTGEEVLAELNAGISSQLDKVAKTLFSSFEPYKKFGEGFTETVIRVVDSNNKVDTALKAIGNTFDNVAGKFDISEAIVKTSGSLENFTTQAKFFIDNFLTEAEKINISRKGVTKSLVDLNLSTNLTREEFKQLVQIQDLTTQTGRDMYKGLLDIQEAFFKATQRLEDLKSESKNLQIELLRTQNNAAAANAALRAIATEGMSEVELQVYNYNQALQAQIDALKEADNVIKQRQALEQKLFQLGNDTVALRFIELQKLDESNRSLQLQIWAVEDYTKVLSLARAAITKAAQDISAAQNAIVSVQSRATDNYVSATQKVSDAQQNIANLAIEAAKKMRDFGKSLRNFVSEQLLPKNNAGNINKQFSASVAAALSGDTAAIEKVPELAQQAIDAAKASSRSSQEFSSLQASILSKVVDVAKFAEQQASLTNIPVEEDPIVVANKALEEALKEQTIALQTANSIGASLLKTPEDLISEYKKANLDLTAAIAQKLMSEETQARAQAALDAIVSNTGNLIAAILGVDAETSQLAILVEKELKSGFNILDTNLDGKLSFAELQKGLAGKATDAEIRALISATDVNADGLISASEAIAAKTDSNTNSLVNTLSNGFNLLDTNLDGKLNFAELQQGLAGKATDAEIRALIAAADTNSDAMLSADEVRAQASKSQRTELTNSIIGQLIGIDANLDGKLTFAELQQGLAGKASDTQIKLLMDAVDFNGDSIIEAYELELLNSTGSIVEALGLGFNQLDTNLDGKLSSAEFMAGMSGKASDRALVDIFKLIDADNDSLISKAEITATQSVLSAVNSGKTAQSTDNIALNTGNTITAIGISADGYATGTGETLQALNNLNNANLQVIVNNTATTVAGINRLLDNNVALFNAMNAVAFNTKLLADSVKAGSGTTAGGGTSSGGFLGLLGKVGSAVGSVVSGVVSGIKSLARKIFSDERTKTNIKLHSRLPNGIGIYDYNYKNEYAQSYGYDRKRGVLAQEVKDQYPDAVSVAKNGMYMVDYSKLPVPSNMLKFALGGVFSNSIITKPTQFPLGLMGEEGPEAVMPLARTRSGGLGVISQPATDTVINNGLLTQNTALIQEIKALREEVSLLRHEARATAVSTTKTTRILERVTQNGESLLVTDAATV